MACKNRSKFCGSRQGRIREGACDCEKIKPLKVMLCLIFRAANKWSCSLSQTSSQAAIIAGGGSVLRRQNEGNITSSDVLTLCFIFPGVVEVCLCLCRCEIVLILIAVSVPPCLWIPRKMQQPGTIPLFPPSQRKTSLRLLFSPESAATFNYKHMMELCMLISVRILLKWMLLGGV